MSGSFFPFNKDGLELLFVIFPKIVGVNDC